MRGSGRTRAMIKALPEGRSVVIVHHHGLRDYVLDLTRAVNVDGGARNVKAVAVSNVFEVQRALVGFSGIVALDHAFRETAPKDVVALAERLAERSALAI